MNSEYEDQTIQDWYDTGKLLVNYDNENAKQNIINNGDNNWVVKNGDEIRPACAIFIQGSSNSIMFSSVKNIVKNGIVFKRNSDSTWTISLYNVNDNDEYEKICYLCHRPESKAGRMFKLPNNICICDNNSCTTQNNILAAPW